MAIAGNTIVTRFGEHHASLGSAREATGAKKYADSRHRWIRVGAPDPRQLRRT
jgi:hypothetical protein